MRSGSSLMDVRSRSGSFYTCAALTDPKGHSNALETVLRRPKRPFETLSTSFCRKCWVVYTFIVIRCATNQYCAQSNKKPD